MTKRRAHYVPRIGDEICMGIAMGDPLVEVLEKVSLAPTLKVFWTWLDTYPEFLTKYERARQMSADVHADRMLKLAGDVIATPSKAGAIKVATDILKWQAEIRNGKKYGSKVQHELTAPPMSPAELRAEIKNLERELGVKAVPGMNTAPVFVRKTEKELAGEIEEPTSKLAPVGTPGCEPPPWDTPDEQEVSRPDPILNTAPEVSEVSHGEAHLFFEVPPVETRQ